MGIYSAEPWFREQLQPLAKLLQPVPPDLLTWLGLGLSMAAGVALFSAYNYPSMAVAAVPLLVARLTVNTLDDMLAERSEKSKQSHELLSETSNRLADIAIFLGLTLSPMVDKVLGLLAIIAVLMVSYVGVLGKAVGTHRVHAGTLGQADRMVFLMVACLIYGVLPNFTYMGYTIFGILFLLFIPLASITLMQRLDTILSALSQKNHDP